jgi:hypothetical protein
MKTNSLFYRGDIDTTGNNRPLKALFYKFQILMLLEKLNELDAG